MTLRIITVFVSNRDDGGLRVCSDDLPGLILSGSNRARVLAAIEPAARGLLERKGEQVDRLRIDARLSVLHPSPAKGGSST